MVRKGLFHFAVALSVTVATLLSTVQVGFASGSVSQGDATSLLQTWDSGFRAVWMIAGVAMAAPMNAAQRGLLHPGSSDGAHYCVDDWHVIVNAWVTGGDATFTYQEALLDLTGISNKFVLDGTTLTNIETTPIVRRVAPVFAEVEYGYSVGSILSPSAIAVGKHQLIYAVVFPDGSGFKTKTTFYMDPSGSAVCAG